MEKLLIIEDDLSIHKILRTLFVDDGFTIEFATDGPSGIAAFRSTHPSLVILDLKLPQMPGRDVCREIRKIAPSLPIVVLSGVTDEVEKVLLLELGADDYVTKPFSPREFLARVRAMLRRSRKPMILDQFEFDEISIDFAKMELKRSGQIVEITPQEFKVLKYFAQTPECVISRNQLLNDVWGYESYPTTRTVDNHIMNLRQKLELDPENPTHFLTVRGVGYKFVPRRAA